jgi:peptidyl-prolyl cis-trans isomerase SurA
MKLRPCIGSLLAGLALAAHSAPPSAVEVNRIIAMVNDAVITVADVRDYVQPNLVMLQKLHGSEPAVFARKRDQFIEEGIRQLVNRRLVLDDFHKSGFALPDNIIDDFIAARIKEQYESRAKLLQELQAEGVTYEAYRQKEKETYIFEMMILRNISSAIIVSPHKVETYYREHTNDFQLPDQVHVRVIELKKSGPGDTSRRRLATELLDKLKEGAVFGELARIYSDGSQRDAGGDWGWSELGIMNKELAEVARSLKPGQNSDIVETDAAVFLVRLEARRAAHVKPLADVRADIEATLFNKERARLQERYFQRLRKTAFIRMFPN